jgi:hypothetical protein
MMRERLMSERDWLHPPFIDHEPFRGRIAWRWCLRPNCMTWVPDGQWFCDAHGWLTAMQFRRPFAEARSDLFH